MTDTEWNSMYPVGILVRYFPIKGVLSEFEDILTRSEAFPLGSGDVVIQLAGKSGSFSIDHITPLDQPTHRRENHEPDRHTHDSHDSRYHARSACAGNKWAEENCKAVGNW